MNKPTEPSSIQGPRLVVALDYPSAEPALALARRLAPARCRLKVGSELFVREGPSLVRQLVDLGYEVFLDLKFHDIPNTVAAACRAAAALDLWMINVHALAGSAALAAAREAVSAAPRPPLLVAVTVLTSHATDDLAELGLEADPDQLVERLAVLAQRHGLDGVVCSAREAAALRQRLPAEFRLVTPGIRPEWAVAGDQRRVVTPRRALQAGADYLVVGRPVTGAEDPIGAVARIEEELQAVAIG